MRPKIPWSSLAEYTGVQAAAREQGWWPDLAAAHLTPCTREQSTDLLYRMHLPNLRIGWRAGSAGRVTIRKGVYRMTLPRDPLQRGERTYGALRVGIVLHEAAHVLGRREHGAFGHDWRYQQILRRLVTIFPWRTYVPAQCSDYPAIYARHRGPYSLLLSTMTIKKVKGEEVLVPGSNRNKGPMSAEEAHDTARMLVSDPRDNVTAAFVFSDTEGQFIGAYYERGQEIPAWDDARRVSAVSRVDPSSDGEETARVPREDDQDEPGESVRSVVDDAAEPAPRRSPKPPALPRVPPPARKAVPLMLDNGNAEQWPRSKGPQILRAWFESEPGRVATVPEIVAACGPALTEAGIQFPASLISRLKQGGFLVPATESDDADSPTD